MQNVKNDFVPCNAFEKTTVGVFNGVKNYLLSESKTTMVRMDHNTGQSKQILVNPTGISIAMDALEIWEGTVALAIIEIWM